MQWLIPGYSVLEIKVICVMPSYFAKLLLSLASKNLKTPCCKNKMIDLGLHFTVPYH